MDRFSGICPEYRSHNQRGADYCRSSRGHNPICPLRFRAALFHPQLHKSKQEINHKGEHCDQQASCHGHCRIIGGNSPVNGNAQTACADERGNTGKGNGHSYHAADPGHNHRHGKGQLDPEKDLEPCAAHSSGRLKNGRVNIGDSRVSIAHHRQQRIYGKRDHGRGISHAGKRYQKSKHRNGRNRIKEINHRQRRLCRPLKFTDQNPRKTACKDGHCNGKERNLQMFQKQPGKKVRPLRKQRPYVFQHLYSPLL